MRLLDVPVIETNQSGSPGNRVSFVMVGKYVPSRSQSVSPAITDPFVSATCNCHGCGLLPLPPVVALGATNHCAPPHIEVTAKSPSKQCLINFIGVFSSNFRTNVALLQSLIPVPTGQTNSPIRSAEAIAAERVMDIYGTPGRCFLLWTLLLPIVLFLDSCFLLLAASQVSGLRFHLSVLIWLSGFSFVWDVVSSHCP
jgi:hypothetical protein